MQQNNYQRESMQELRQRLNLPIKDIFLLQRAMTHRSYLNENHEVLEDNERLEFLGDAIISFIVADWIYNKFPDKPEGSLTKLRAALVSTNQLANFARVMNLGTGLLLGNGEDLAGGRKRNAILCDAFEALIGAIFLDSGIEATRLFLVPIITEATGKILILHTDEDPKSALQEWAQSNGLNSPMYVEAGQSGPEHAKSFQMEVMIDGKSCAIGQGSSKQTAEKNAAQKALEFLGLLETE